MTTTTRIDETPPTAENELFRTVLKTIHDFRANHPEMEVTDIAKALFSVAALTLARSEENAAADAAVARALLERELVDWGLEVE